MLNMHSESRIRFVSFLLVLAIKNIENETALLYVTIRKRSNATAGIHKVFIQVSYSRKYVFVIPSSSVNNTKTRQTQYHGFR